VHALRNLSLKFEEGKFYVIAGTSGSGKTTLINLLAGIDLPSKGSIIVDGKDMAGMKEKQRCSFRLENMGLVFQFFYLVPYLTGKENVMLPMRYARKIAEPEKRAMHLLKLVNGEHLADKKPVHMSGVRCRELQLQERWQINRNICWRMSPRRISTGKIKRGYGKFSRR